MPYLLATSVKVAFGDLRSLRTLNTVATESLPPKVKGVIFHRMSSCSEDTGTFLHDR